LRAASAALIKSVRLACTGAAPHQKDDGHLAAVFFVPPPANTPANQSTNKQRRASMSLSRSTSENPAVDAVQDAADAVQDAVDAVQELRELSLDVIVANPSQPRRHFDDEALQELAGSVSECGVLQPVLVHLRLDGKYELLAGERRWRAAKLAGLQSIPALVSRYDDRASLEVGLIENMAREDLNPVEKARAFSTLMDEFGLIREQIGRRVGCHKSVVSNLTSLLKLSDEILELLECGELSAGHGSALLRAKNLDARLPLARAAIDEEWTVRTLEARACASNVALLESQHRGEQVRDPEQAQDLAALNLARAWGDLLGAEVNVRPIRQQLRMEVVFDLAADGIALAERLATVVSRGSKGR
jgi:ParB family transcriptional regulator, chromosome partitioning protein